MSYLVLPFVVYRSKESFSALITSVGEEPREETNV